MEVDFFGVKIDLPDEQARAVIEARDKRVDEFNGLKTSVESLQRQQAAAEQQRVELERKAQAEAERAAALEKAKQGDVEAALQEREEAMAKQYGEQLTGLQRQLKAQSMRALLASRKDIMPEAVKDAEALLGGVLEWHDGKLVPMVDGRPAAKDDKETEAWLSSWINDRPYLKASNVPPGQGGQGDDDGGPSMRIPRSQVANLTAEQSQALADGRATVVDG
jgi:hypothetical protein